MAQYIDKSALVVEIERRLEELSQLEKASYEIGLYDAYKIVLSFLDTLEVKEVDLDLGSPDGDMGIKTVWDGDKIVSSKVQKGE